MSDEKLDVPKPNRRDVHRDGGPWARGSGRWEWTIVEREFDNMLFLEGSAKPPEHQWVMGDYFTGLIALRASEGWVLLNATANSATMMKMRASYDGTAKLTP